VLVQTTSARPVRLAVDIGGTFTDLQIFDARTGTLASLKTATTPEDPSLGLIFGVKEAARRHGFALADVGYLLHGTTIATNAVLERKLPAGALVTTANFEDVLEIGRHYRREVYAINPQPPPALIPRDRRIGIDERVRADGSIATALTERALAELAERLAAIDVAAVAVCLINSYRNPAHERRIAEHLAQTLPHLRIACSNDVSPEIREYERTSTTVLNALLMPVVADYLERLVRRMAQEQFSPTLLLVQSNGGVCSAATAARQPVRLLLSGPSGGAAACARLAAALEADHLVGIDMGGTSFDVSVIRDRRVTLNMQGDIERMPVRLPMVEIRSIGAGGGSLAKVSPGGRLTIGPISAGARPGPACYGRGGSEPTVTDANAALGRLDPKGFLGGEMALDIAAARAAIDSDVARPLEMPIEAAAEGILALTNTNLGAAIRLSLFEKGLNPREFALAAFGGAAGLHALAVADELGISRVIFPANAGTLSAFGILHSDLTHDLVRSRVAEAMPAAVDLLAPLVRGLVAEAGASLDADAVPIDARCVELSADMRYRGQAFELTVPLAGSRWDQGALDALLADFHAMHRQRFSYADPGAAVEIVSLRAAAIGRLTTPAGFARARNGGLCPRRKREVRLDGAWQRLDVWRRDAMASGQQIRGPAIIEEDYTTVLITGGWTCLRRDDGHLIATRDITDSGISSASCPRRNGVRAMWSSRTIPTPADSTCPTSRRSRQCFAPAAASDSSARFVTTSTSAAPRPAATARARPRFSRRGFASRP
jgi:N-methylhydantoinase A